MSEHGMCELVLQVSADQFLSLRKDPTLPINEKLKEKYEYLLASFPCFTITPSQPNQATTHSHSHNHTSGQHYHHGKNKKNRNDNKGNRTEKVKIGCRDLSRENFGRKDFMALMNKMTAANKDTILQSIRNAYRDDCQSIYTEILWTMMQKSPEFHELHWSVITAIRDVTDHKEGWQESWKEIARAFIAEEKWIPPDSMLQSEDYDEFCDFVKWRKSTIAAIRSLCMLEDREWIDCTFRMSVANAIMSSLQTRMEDPNATGDKVTDTFIEQLHTMISITQAAVKTKAEAVAKAEAPAGLIQVASEWFDTHVDDVLYKRLRPATRFKMYDLCDIIERKMKTT